MNIKLNSENQPFPFVPRSVLMALESQSAKTKDKKNKSAKKGRNSLEGSRGVLLKSIAGFLESNGFKKTLDMFISEAQIQENSWKSSAVNLDDIVSRFFDSSSGKEAVAIQCEKPQDNDNETEKKKRKSSNGNVDDSETPVEEGEEAKKERKEKKKKKKKKKSNVDKSTPVKEEIEEPKEEIKEAKDEKKKKSKKQKEQLENKVEELKSSNDENKDEKKRKQKKEVKELNEIGDKEKENKGINHENDKEKSTVEQQNGENGEKKVSKKRKKPDSEEENDYEANIGNDINAPVIENGNKEPKSGKKDKSSDEPKSANAFKRVKIEEVKFADQRLQDNSYWAKDGADSGYGAKAQQILEQVRGRDFRHEKTKKKRGSYRGGQIDLQSHSIKFNYSDEE